MKSMRVEAKRKKNNYFSISVYIWLRYTLNYFGAIEILTKKLNEEETEEKKLTCVRPSK